MIKPPARAGAGPVGTAPRMDPFPVMENDDVKVTAILVHEAYHREGVAAIGYPPAVVEHIGAVHTEVGDLGVVGAEAGARRVVISHISPADPNLLSDAAWQRAADQSARYPGRITLGNDLDRFPLAKPGKGK
ncbi:hypothetical protein ACQPZ8_28120 [Actinomadura nitritigenes]|uniref:hypothetical protein n=1 Tax=Actinomadura nitritigenes TaxID=134602 RepID=UPI003D8AA395